MIQADVFFIFATITMRRRHRYSQRYLPENSIIYIYISIICGTVSFHCGINCGAYGAVKLIRRFEGQYFFFGPCCK